MIESLFISSLMAFVLMLLFSLVERKVYGENSDQTYFSVGLFCVIAVLFGLLYWLSEAVK